MRVRRPTLPLATLLPVAVALLLGAPAVATAQAKIAVIDVQRAITESATGKKAQAELETLQTQKRAELEAKRNELLDLKKKLEEGRLSLAQDKLETMTQEYEEKAIELKRGEDDANRVLQSRGEKLMADVENKVLPVITEIGKAEGYTLIFNKFRSGLLYADDAVDITQQVITRLDQANP